MKALLFGILAVAVTFCAASAQNKHTGSDKDRLIGAWHLAQIKTGAPEDAAHPMPQPKGMLIYTRDGHMSVQLMYPAAPGTMPSNQYVKDGYEASFGSYDIDETTHTLTHHVQGSITRDLLVGKNLPRVYEISQDGHLIIKSARPDEHWSVTWEHF